MFIIPATLGLTGKILVADVHWAQQTVDVKAFLEKKKMELVNVPPSCTSCIKYFDKSF